MVIEKVHGLHATGMSLSDRFTMLSSTAPVRVAPSRKRRHNSDFANHNSIASLLSQTNLKNQDLINQIARKLEQQAKRKALRQRLGVPPGALRRFGSETSLPGLRRSNSSGNLSQNNFQNRAQLRGSSNNLSRSASSGNLNQLNARGRQLHWGFKRRGRGSRGLRGRVRGVSQGRVTRSQTAHRGRGQTAPRGGGVQRGRMMQGRRGVPGGRGAVGGRGARGRGSGRGAPGRGRGRGGIRRQTTLAQPMPSKEELDNQLDEYMACTKSALDKELDNYMKTAMEMDTLL